MTYPYTEEDEKKFENTALIRRNITQILLRINYNAQKYLLPKVWLPTRHFAKEFLATSLNKKAAPK
jgi:hypothetical protein